MPFKARIDLLCRLATASIWLEACLIVLIFLLIAGSNLQDSLQDTEDSPEPVSGWSPERAKKFGASVLGPIYEVLPVLREVPKPFTRSTSRRE